MTQFHSDQFMPFQINDIAFELLRDYQPVRNLVWKCRLPDPIERSWRGILAHHLHSVGRGGRFGIWEALKKSADAKPMVSMTMCNVDVCQVLAACSYPICESVGLLDRHERIHQDGVPHAIDKGRRHRLKICLSHASWHVGRDNRYPRRHEHVPM